MNIQTIRDNLKNTIAGKEIYLANATKIRDEQDLTPEQDSANYVTIQFLKINIAELKRILADVEQCTYSQADIDNYEQRVAKDIEQSWRDNPCLELLGG